MVPWTTSEENRDTYPSTCLTRAAHCWELGLCHLQREQYLCTWPTLISVTVDICSGCLSPKPAPSAFPTTHCGDGELGSRPAAGQHAQGHSHCRSGNKSAVREIQRVSKSPRFLSKRHDGVMMFNGIQSTLTANGRLFRPRQPSLGIKTVMGRSNPWNNWSGPTASSSAATSFDRRTISTSSCPKVCARSGLTSLWSRMVLKAKVV